MRRIFFAINLSIVRAVFVITVAFILLLSAKVCFLGLVGGRVAVNGWLLHLSNAGGLPTVNLAVGFLFLLSVCLAARVVEKSWRREADIEEIRREIGILGTRCKGIVDSPLVDSTFQTIQNRVKTEAENNSCRSAIIDVPSTCLRILEHQLPDKAKELEKVRRQWLLKVKYPAVISRD